MKHFLEIKVQSEEHGHRLNRQNTVQAAVKQDNQHAVKAGELPREAAKLK